MDLTIWQQAQRKAVKLLRLLQTESAFLVLVWTLRAGLLLLVTLYFVAHPVADGTARGEIRVGLFVFYAYVVATGVGGVYARNWFRSPRVKFGQILFEIVLYSVLYSLAGAGRSEFHFLYLLPLLLAVRFFGTLNSLALFALTSILLYLFLFNSAPVQAGIGSGAITGDSLAAYLHQELDLLALYFFAALTNRRVHFTHIGEVKSQLVASFEGYTDGVYVVDQAHRLLYANEVLKACHGDYTPGQSCSSYLSCSARDARLCTSLSGSLLEPADGKSIQSTLHDRDGHPYRAEITHSSVAGEDGEKSVVVGIVRNITAAQETQRRLLESYSRYERQVETSVMESKNWANAFHELGKHLAGSHAVEELLRFVVGTAMARLDAEAAAVFMLQEGRLVREAAAGVEDAWFPTESYGVGQGLTGDALVGANGGPYGKSVCENDVDHSPRVVAEHLSKYEEKLKTHQVKHLLAVPLNGHDRSFGMLRVLNKLDAQRHLSSKGFTPKDVAFLESIASMAAIAIEGQAQSAERLGTLFTIAQRITQSIDHSELLQVVVGEAQRIIPQAGKAIIHLVDPVTNFLKAEAISAATSSRREEPTLRVDNGVAGVALRERRKIYVPDTLRDPRFLPGESEIKSLLVVPLMAGEKAIGTLSVDSTAADAFSLDEQQVLEGLAAQAATAIDKSRVYARERTLREVSAIVSSSLEIDEVLCHLLDQLNTLIPHDSVSIQRLDGRELKVIACRGFADESRVMQLTFPSDDPKFPNARVIGNRENVIVRDAHLEYPHFLREKEKYFSEHIRSWLGIPLIVKDKAIGMISIEKSIPGYYTEADAKIARAFANQVAIAVENATLFEKTQRQMQEVGRLHEASKVITSSLEQKKVLELIVTEAARLAGLGHASIVLVGRDGSLRESFDDTATAWRLHIRARPNGITRQVIDGGEPIIFDEVVDDGVTHNPHIFQKGYQAYGAFPVGTRGQVRAVLFLHSHRPNVIREREALLRTYCLQAATAIDNAWYYKRATEQAEVLKELVETSEKLLAHTGLEELCRFCAETGAKIFDVEDCSLYLRNDVRQSVDLVASSGIPPQIWTKRTALLDKPGLTACVINTGAVLNFGGDEYRSHPAWGGNAEGAFLEHLEWLPSKRCHSLLLAPLVDSKGKTVGVLKLENKLGEGAGFRFSEFEVTMHKTFASLVGIAIERANLYHQLDEEAKRKARESLGEDLHDILNLIHGTLILGSAYAIELLRYGRSSAAWVQLEKMAKAAKSIHEDLRRIHRDVRDPVLEEKGLEAALRQYAANLQVPATFRIPAQLVIPPDVEYTLYKIGQEGLHNASKHARTFERELGVTIRVRKTPRSTLLIVRDNGKGFDTDRELKRSDAFGYQAMQRWAKSIGAQLKVSSRPERGTRVAVILPLEGDAYGQ